MASGASKDAALVHVQEVCVDVADANHVGHLQQRQKTTINQDVSHFGDQAPKRKSQPDGNDKDRPFCFFLFVVDKRLVHQIQFVSDGMQVQDEIKRRDC